MSLIDLDGVAKTLAASLTPVIRTGLDQVRDETIPALGDQMKEVIAQAVAGAGTDSKEAIAALTKSVDDLVPLLEQAIERAGVAIANAAFDRLEKMLSRLGTKDA